MKSANEFFVNGKKYACKNSMVVAGTTKADSLLIRLYPARKVMLSLNDQEPVQIEVQQPCTLQPAIISALTIKPLVQLGGQQQLKFNIQNVNGKMQTFIIPLKINHKLLFNDTVMLAAGAKKNISHTFNCLNNGFQKVEVYGSSLLFKVYMVDVFTKGDNHVLQINNNQTLTFFAGGWGRGDCTANLPANWNNTWHHIAGVCQGSKLMLYIDGDLAATTTTANTVNLSGNNKWVLGRNEEFPSERFFHGQIDKAKVFGTALSSSEIKSISRSEKR